MTKLRGAAGTEAYGEGPGETSLPRASLIIPSRNRGQLLLETIESVLAGDTVPDEIIAVDQSDELDPALERLSRIHKGTVRYVWDPEPGVSKARNRGIREARNDVLVFVDDDVRVTRSWYRDLVSALCVAGERAVVTGRVLPEVSSQGGGFVPSTIDDPNPAVYHGRIKTDILYSNNMALWRSIINAAGPFDERLGAGTKFRNAEDNELGFRILEAGFEIHYTPDATVYHRAWRSRSDYHALSWSYGYGQGAYYAKHTSLRDRHMLWRLRHDLGQRFLRFVRFSTRQPHRAVGQIVYMAGLLTGWAHWLISRPDHRT
jgi:GT2 family glycosyltransferase